MRKTDCHTSDIGHWFAMTKNGLCLHIAVILSGAKDDSNVIVAQRHFI